MNILNIYSQLRLKNNSFLLDILKLVSGTAFAQIITLIASPFITRLYSPEAFGLSQLFISFTSIISMIICLRYDVAIMLPKEENEAKGLVIISCVIGTIVSVVIIIVLKWFGISFLEVIKSTDLEPFLVHISIISFVIGLNNVFGYWNSRKRKYGLVSSSRLINSFVIIVIQIYLAIIGCATGTSLIYANIIGAIISFTFFIIMIRKDINFREIPKDTISLLPIIKRYSKFPLVELWSTLLNSISWQLPAFMLVVYFDRSMVGHFSLAFRLINIPALLIGSSISQVFYQRTSKLVAEGQSISIVVNRVFDTLVSILIFPAFLLGVIGKEFFVIVFGQAWAISGVFVQILSSWMAVWFISSPLSTLFNIFHKQEKALGLNICIVITRFLALLIGGVQNNIFLGLGIYSITGILLYGYQIIWAMRTSNVPLKNVFSCVKTNIIYCFPIIFVVVTKLVFTNKPFYILSVGLISSVLYYWILLKRKPEFLKPNLLINY